MKEIIVTSSWSKDLFAWVSTATYDNKPIALEHHRMVYITYSKIINTIMNLDDLLTWDISKNGRSAMIIFRKETINKD